MCVDEASISSTGHFFSDYYEKHLPYHIVAGGAS